MINDNINPISQGAVPVKNVLLAIALVILLGDLANSQIDDSTPPPLNKERMVGEWEAITQLPLPTFLLHLESRLYEPSFLVTKLLDRRARKFLSSYPRKSVMDMRSSVSGPVGDGSEEGHDIRDVWLEGIAHGGGNVSVFRAKMWKDGESPPKDAEDILFVKGAWTRDIATASKEAEEIIQEQSRKSSRE